LTQNAIRFLLSRSKSITADAVRQYLGDHSKIKPLTAVTVDHIHLKDYDALLDSCQEVLAHG